MNSKYSHKNGKKTTPNNLLLSSIATAGCLLCITIFDSQAATAFEGALKSVTITDSAGINARPVAVIGYTKDSGI